MATLQAKPFQRLTVKIVGILVFSLVLALISVGYTLLISWQLEGGAAAINDAGSLRMRTYHLQIVLEQYVAGEVGTESVSKEIAQIQNTLANLKRGDPIRPLYLPKEANIQALLHALEQSWSQGLSVQARQVISSADSVGRHQALHNYQSRMDDFVGEINQLVSRIEQDNAGKTWLLRTLQMLLLGMAVFGTIAMIQLMFLWIIRPVLKLHAGMERMGQQDFSVRLPVESQDEFGQLTAGFNQMADRLSDLYSTLEQRVQSKTALLASQNRELSCLYEIAAFLNEPQGLEEMCRGFLARLIRHFEAGGGTVRLIDATGGRAHIVVSQGLSDELLHAEHCLKVGDCLCGEAVVKGVSIVHDFRKMPPSSQYRCEKEGFASLGVFQVRSGTRIVGFFNLHFRNERPFSKPEVHLLETLGQNLGVALTNQQLSEKQKKHAVAEERNLMAQGLHDSIAQGLNFLNLQVQMLADSLNRQALGEAEEIVPLLRAGIQESYDDVRELLQNFRARLGEGDLAKSMRTTLEKFERQSGIKTRFDWLGEGAPLSTDEQLQVLFILQEALSNIRKHASARIVSVSVQNDLDFSMLIHDDGVGFELEALGLKGEGHVGVKIMQERAQRIQANWEIRSAPGNGTDIALTLPRAVRRAQETTISSGEHNE